MKYIILSVLLLLLSCSQQSKIEGEVKIMDQSVIENLKSLEKIKIYFGHQSVGYNIMDGLEDLMQEAGNNSIKIIESDGSNKLPEYYFAHSRVGNNTEPSTKCDAFSEILSEEFAKQLDFALLKFCYVDMGAKDDPTAVYEYYKTTIDSIKKKYPHLTIIHITIPLTTIQTGWKVPIKKLLDKEIQGHAENINRYIFNSLLKKYYKNDPIFDLSEVESTYPDGSRALFEQDGKTYFSLISEYTYDGGHLNELGRQLVAKELVKILDSIVKNKNEYLN
jgi:hypothetical protein